MHAPAGSLGAGGVNRGRRRQASQHLGEDEHRAAAVRLAEVEVVDHGADDGDAHAAVAQLELGHVLALGAVDVVLVEAAALVADLDGDAVGVHGEVEVHLAVVVVVGVPHGVGARLGERQLEIGDGVVGVAARAQQTRKRKAAEHDVLGLGGDIELHVVVHGLSNRSGIGWPLHFHLRFVRTFTFSPHIAHSVPRRATSSTALPVRRTRRRLQFGHTVFSPS